MQKFTDSGEILVKISLPSFDWEFTESDLNGETNATLVVEVSDTGIGIGDTYVKNIWESFSQGDSSMTRPQDGTGLGLSICKYLITINGGDLGVQSQVGKGSRFWFTWNIELSPPTITSSTSPLKYDINSVIPASLRSKYIILIHPNMAARTSIVAMIKPIVEKVDAFESYDTAWAVIKARRQQNQHVVLLLNVPENNKEQVTDAAKEFQSLFGKEKLEIRLLIFWSDVDRLLGKEMIKKIRGNAAVLCKPITQRRLLDSLSDDQLSNYVESDQFSAIKTNASSALDEPRVEEDNYHDPSKVSTPDIILNTNIMGSGINLQESDHIGTVMPDAGIMQDNSAFTTTGKTIPNKRLAPIGHEPAPKSRTRVTSASKCILCVEDNPINLKIIKHQLSNLGYKYLSVANGKEAVDLIASEFVNTTSPVSPNDNATSSHKISLILMDCAMPVMSGFDATRAIREMGPVTARIPIIALTASLGTREKCLESGMNDYLTKPLKIGELKDKLDLWLGES